MGGAGERLGTQREEVTEINISNTKQSSRNKGIGKLCRGEPGSKIRDIKQREY